MRKSIPGIRNSINPDAVLHEELRTFPNVSEGKQSACNAGDPGLLPGSGRSPAEGNGYSLSILAWEISETEEPGGPQSMASQESTGVSTFTFFT